MDIHKHQGQAPSIEADQQALRPSIKHHVQTVTTDEHRACAALRVMARTRVETSIVKYNLYKTCKEILLIC